MKGLFTASLIALATAGCTGWSSQRPPDPGVESEPRTNALPALALGAQTNYRDTLAALPAEAIVERFSFTSGTARLDYIGIAATNLGGVVFEGGRFVGHLSAESADAFLACRGLHSAQAGSWLVERAAWEKSLREAMRRDPLEVVWPRDAMSLKNTFGELRERLNALQGLRSLVEAGSSPSGLARSLESLGNQFSDSNARERRSQFLAAFAPGERETALVSELGVDIARYTREGLLLNYPKQGVTALVRAGAVEAPAIGPTARVTPESLAAAYRPGVHWERCSPAGWASAKLM